MPAPFVALQRRDLDEHLRTAAAAHAAAAATAIAALEARVAERGWAEVPVRLSVNASFHNGQKKASLSEPFALGPGLRGWCAAARAPAPPPPRPTPSLRAPMHPPP